MAVFVERTVFSNRENRTLFVAIVGSLLLHVALVLVLPMLRDAPQQRTKPREPVIARLAEPHRNPAPITPPSMSPVREMEQAASESRDRPQVREKSKPNAKPEAISVREFDQAAPKAEVSTAMPTSTQPSPPVSDSPDAGTLAQYRLALMGAAKRYNGYPPLALENRWQGRVEVRIVVGADGSISSLTVHSSTGHSVLDAQALDMIQRAQPAAQLPPALRGRQFIVDIPVEFALRKPGA